MFDLILHFQKPFDSATFFQFSSKNQYISPWDWNETIDHSTSVSSLYEPRGFWGDSGALVGTGLASGENYSDEAFPEAPTDTSKGPLTQTSLPLAPVHGTQTEISHMSPLRPSLILILPFGVCCDPHLLRSMSDFNGAYAPSFVWRLAVELHLSNGV